MLWQQSIGLEGFAWTELSEAGAGVVEFPAAWAWQCASLVPVANPVRMEAAAGPASRKPAASCQSSKTAITSFGRGRHILIGR